MAFNANAASWNVDIFNGGRSSINTGSGGTTSATATATDDVHNCNDSPPTVTLTAPADCPYSGCTITATISQGTHALTDGQRPQFPGRVTFTLNGQTIHSAQLATSPSTISFTYRPTSTGSGTLIANVTDSVLYQSSGRQAMNFSAAPPPETSEGEAPPPGTPPVPGTP